MTSGELINDKEGQYIPKYKTEDESIFEVIWEGPLDPDNPVNWPRSRKWLYSSIGYGFMTLVGASVAGYAISQPSLQRTLGISQFAASLGIVTFSISYGAAPLVLAPLSEVYGRLPILVAATTIFWIMFLPGALAKNLETILITKFISGIGASTAVSLVGGTLADMWKTHERGLPMAIFSFVAFAGNGLGPLSLGYVELSLGFRYVNWILFGVSGLFTIALIVLMRETRASVILMHKAVKIRKETGDVRYRAKAEDERGSIATMLKVSLTRPIRLFFTEPLVFTFALWITYAWSILYIQLESISLIFTDLYRFNIGENGLVFATQIVGPAIGLLVNLWCERLYHRKIATKGPEARLYIAMVAGTALPLGCWIYTWTAWPQVHFIFPIIGLTVIYASMSGIYTATFNYITDSYTIYSSSALGGLSCFRLVLGGLFTLAAPPLYDNLGIHAAGSLISGLATLFAATPFVMFYYGSKIRARSPFAKQLAQTSSTTSSIINTPDGKRYLAVDAEQRSITSQVHRT